MPLYNSADYEELKTQQSRTFLDRFFANCRLMQNRLYWKIYNNVTNDYENLIFNVGHFHVSIHTVIQTQFARDDSNPVLL